MRRVGRALPWVTSIAIMRTAVSDSAGLSLWDISGEFPNRRGAKGRRYSLHSVPVLTLAAMLSGINDLRAVYRRGRRLPEDALSAPGLNQAPRHATWRYFFKALDAEAAERAPGHVAPDGKRLWGSAPAGHDGGKEGHLVSAFAGRPGAAIRQLRMSPESNEATAAAAQGCSCHRRCGVLPARLVRGRPRRGRWPFVHGQGQPAGLDVRHRRFLRRCFPPFSRARRRVARHRRSRQSRCPTRICRDRREGP